MLNRYVEVTDEYVKQLEHEIDNLNAINEEHKKINGKLREEYNKIQNLYESVFAESKKQKEVIDEIEKYLKNDIESCNSALSNPEYTIINKHSLLKNEKRKDIDMLKIIQKAKGDFKNEN